ncbi:hypothetical protein B0H67DRAFT_156208 [Lasiosphaeris hirsuta]|uniref:Uncharacterized protein n=1 Tax=Lasiosphaeris hirsuta TaxID=260670 RepID=A0AA40APD8_9PEZI|nr:hypothetical protein B0H67DRAFT_156208 [Lasiosphaeris hirsuta]
MGWCCVTPSPIPAYFSRFLGNLIRTLSLKSNVRLLCAILGPLSSSRTLSRILQKTLCPNGEGALRQGLDFSTAPYRVFKRHFRQSVFAYKYLLVAGLWKSSGLPGADRVPHRALPGTSGQETAQGSSIRLLG